MIEADSSPNIISFIIRFIHLEATDTGETPAYRGNIRHIQSNQEFNFTRWEDAVEYIRRFVPIVGVKSE